MAVSQYDKNNLTQADQDKIADVTSKAEKGEIGWSDAHYQAEAIRGNAGYSGAGMETNIFTPVALMLPAVLAIRRLDSAEVAPAAAADTAVHPIIRSI